MERLSFKVPQKDKQIFLSPSGDKIASVLEENKKIFSQYSFAILNQPFREVREKSRKEVIQRALKFSKKFDPDIAEKINPAYQYIIQSGHQPVFFHPGIWIKNIFLNHLIKSLLPDKSLGLNMFLFIIDRNKNNAFCFCLIIYHIVHIKVFLIYFNCASLFVS